MMNTSMHAHPPSWKIRSRQSFWQRVLPEGPVIFLLLLGVNLCAAMGVTRGGWDHLIIELPLLAGLGMVSGTVLARSKVIDTLAHGVSLVIGLAVTYLLILGQVTDFGETRWQRVKPLFWHIRDWYLGDSLAQQKNDAIVISLMLGLLTWMLAYLSAWVLFRRGWLLFALLFPAIPLLANFGYAPDPDARWLAFFLLLAVPLAARHHLYRKQVMWSRLHMAGPRTLGLRFLSIGAVLALLTTSAGWNAPESLSHDALNPLFSQMGKKIEAARQTADEWIEEKVSGTGDEPLESGAAYSDFQSSFSIGGGVNLTNQPEVLVESDTPEYLVAQHYNVYSGRGWSSDVTDTFDPIGPDGTRYAPAMLFRAGQSVELSDASSGARGMHQVQITPLTQLNGVLLTVDTFVAANVDASVRMSWIQLDNTPFVIGTDAIPPDLRKLVNFLGEEPLTGTISEYGPLSEDSQANIRLVTEREALAGRFLDVQWDADASGNLTTIYVTGQIPVYDDVESVAPRQSIPANGSYRVRGSESEATLAELQQAGTSIPDWVMQRYLQLPDTITPRTTELAYEITAGSASVYDKAKAIETYLRQAITYDTDVGAPPDDRDVVDYLLFENPRGYCEHYATAMTVMLRTLGIPARVVAGYAPGTWDADLGGYLYLQSNAHAWVEVFIAGYGWIPFEPTASEAPRNLAGDVTQDLPSEDQEPFDPLEEPESTITPAADDVASTPPAAGEDAPLAPVEEAGGDQDGGGPSGTLLLVGGVVLSVALIGGTVWWLWMRRLWGLSLAAGLFARLVRMGHFLGVDRKLSTTPREFADAMGQRSPGMTSYAQRIVDAYELDQYADQGAERTVIESARRAWKKSRTLMIPSMVRRFLPRRSRKRK